MKALSQYWSVPLPNVDELMALGADIPVCMTTGLTLMEGAGEDVTQLSTAPNWGLILVNPNVGVSTPAVFNALNSKQNPPMQDVAENCIDIAWLGDQRNDLEPPAMTMVPEVAAVVDAISAFHSVRWPECRDQVPHALVFSRISSMQMRQQATCKRPIQTGGLSPQKWFKKRATPRRSPNPVGLFSIHYQATRIGFAVLCSTNPRHLCVSLQSRPLCASN